MPALVGYLLSNGDSVFSGVVFNPIDGYTYLAKMEIGSAGDWLFSLPFTASPGEGRLLFPFYIMAGQFFQIVGVPLSAGFNILRLLAYGCLVLVLFRLADCIFQDKTDSRGLSVFLMAAGGGLGWLLLPFGKYGADFWVSEAFPFLAGLANPHFPLALALMVFSVILFKHPKTGWRRLVFGLIAIFLSILSPFGFVLMSFVLIFAWVWERLDGQSSALLPVLIFVTAGLPYSIYQYWAVGSTPQLVAWTAQNQTPSPQIWDVLLSFSPWILLIFVGWRYVYALKNNPVVRRLIIWVIVGLLLTVIPYNLQRRFMIGLSIPITSLGLLVLPTIAPQLKISIRKFLPICAAATIPTTILILLMVSFAIGTRTPMYYYQWDELKAVEWLSQQKDGKALVLASDQSGLFIPAVSRLRVLYGHPFETVDAENEKQSVTDFFTGKLNLAAEKDYLKRKRVNWIFYGQRESELGVPGIINGRVPSMQFGSVKIFDVAEFKD